ncbi:endoglucanase [Caudovirales GX15bay]|nr:endoglucanase [Caudovirales GX15bay]
MQRSSSSSEVIEGRVGGQPATSPHIVDFPAVETPVRKRFGPRTRRARITTAVLFAVFVVICVVIWNTPPVKRWPSGPTPDQVALQREVARANDLKRQLDQMQNEPDARAEDLKRQVEELEAKLGIPRPDDQSARAGDLKGRLDAAEARLREPRPPVTDPVAAARAADLAQQNEHLNALVTAPRPTEDPLAGVSATLTKDQILASEKMFGLYTEQAPFNYAEVSLIQQQVNRKANIVGYFQSWNGPFRPDAVKQTWKRGQIPLLTWESQPQVGAVTPDVPEYSMPKIIDGAYDDYIRTYAQGIRSVGLPLILRFDHEMNGTWYPWSETKSTTGESINGNSKGDYVRMWRHVHDVFEQEGANQFVMWLWAPNRVNAIPNQPPPVAFYPGDDYVDFIGMSGYYRPYDNGPYFSETHGKTLPLLREATRNKRILLAEMGATELNGQKSLWIESLFRNLPENPDVVGFVWFSLTVTARHEGQTQTNDWRINSSSSTVDTVREQLAISGWGLPAG